MTLARFAVIIVGVFLAGFLSGDSVYVATVDARENVIPAQLIEAPAPDVWNRLAEVWNPFATQMRDGKLDLVGWHKVLKQIYSMEGCVCDPKKGRI